MTNTPKRLKRGIRCRMKTIVHHLKRSMKHHEVTEEIQILMNEKHYRFVQALKIVLQQNSSLFGELTDSEEEDDDRSTDEESEEESFEMDWESDPHAQNESPQKVTRPLTIR